MRVQGTATLGGIHNNTSARDNAQLELYQDLGNGVMSNVGVQGRNSTTWFQGYGENFGRSRPVHVPARRHVRRVQVRRVPQRHPAHVLVFRLHALRRQRRQPADGDVPACGHHGHPADRVERVHAGLRPPRLRAATRSGRRTARGTSGSTATRSSSAAPGPAPRPTARARATATPTSRFPQDFKTNNWGVEGGYQSGKATFAVRWDYSKFENSNETLRWTNPFFGPA